MATKSSLKIGSLLRKLRKEQRMTGDTLAKKTGLSQSKISKLETGVHTTPSIHDVEKILNILQAPKTIQQQVFLLLEEVHIYSPRQNQYVIPTIKGIGELEKNVARIRVHTIGMLPLLFQTVDYRLGYLRRQGAPVESLDGLVQEMIKRQDALWSEGRKVTAIINETALYTLVASKRVQSAQLDRLERLLDTPHTRVGIIPLEAGLATVENGPFCLYDDSVLAKGVAEGEMRTRDKEDILLYINVFKELEDKAWFGDQAKVLVRKAVDYLA